MLGVSNDRLNRYLSMVLLPVRLMGLVVTLMGGGIGIVVCRASATQYLDAWVTMTASKLLFFLGVSVHTVQDGGYFGFTDLYQSNRFLTIFNHSHPLDGLVLLGSMGRPLTGLVNPQYHNHAMVRVADFLLLDWLLISNKVPVDKLIKNHYQTTQTHCLVINSYRLSELRQAYRSKTPVVPISIRYIPSQRYLNLDTPGGYLAKLIKVLLDGHTEVWVKISMAEYQSHYQYQSQSNYQPSLSNIITTNLRELPPATPPRILPQRVEGYKYTWVLLSFLGILCFEPRVRYASILGMGITGWTASNYPNNNTKLASFLVYRLVQLAVVAAWLRSIGLSVGRYYPTLIWLFTVSYNYITRILIKLHVC